MKRICLLYTSHAVQGVQHLVPPPTGQVVFTAGVVLDIAKVQRCPKDDQNFVVADPLDFNRVVPRVQFMLSLIHISTQPGVQLYTSNFLKSATACKDGASYGQYSACLLYTSPPSLRQASMEPLLLAT